MACILKEKKLKLLLSAHVFHTAAKRIILSGGKNENGCDMYKNEKCTCKVCKITLVKYADFLTFLSLDV